MKHKQNTFVILTTTLFHVPNFEAFLYFKGTTKMHLTKTVFIFLSGPKKLLFVED